MPTTRENCQKYCGLCAGDCKVSLDHYIFLEYFVRYLDSFLNRSILMTPFIPISASLNPLTGIYNSEKKTKLCNYSCKNNGGCEVQYIGPPRGGQILGSCFPPSFGGGKCSGTPRECNDCNKVLNCYEPKYWK